MVAPKTQITTRRRIHMRKPSFKKSKSLVSSDNDDLCVRNILRELTEDEMEMAARSSFQYFNNKINNNNKICQICGKKNMMMSNSLSKEGARPQEEKDISQEKEKMAFAMARRHWIAEKKNEKRALEKMKKTLQAREEWKIDDIRQCFDTQTQTQKQNCCTICGFDNCSDYKEHDDHYSELRSIFEEELSTCKMMVRGYDKENRALLNIFPRFDNGFHPKNYTWVHLYMLERAIACTERASNGAQENVVVLVDFKDYKKSRAPPLELAKKMIFMLKDHYPERLHCVYLVDAPVIFRAFWAMVKPFIDPTTKKKFRFVSGDDQKKKEFSGVISPDQAMPFIRPDGKLVSSMDEKAFLHNTPFNYAYGEKF